MKLHNALTAVAVIGIAMISTHATAIGAPPVLPDPATRVPPPPQPDFKFVVPVAVKNLHPQAVIKGVWVVCNVYDHTVTERDRAHTELESRWSLAKAEEIQRWHLGQGKTKLPLSADGAFDGKIAVSVDVDVGSGEASDGRSWECHLSITASKLPTRDRSKPAFLRARPGTPFAPVHRGDL